MGFRNRIGFRQKIIIPCQQDNPAHVMINNQIIDLRLIVCIRSLKSNQKQLSYAFFRRHGG